MTTLQAKLESEFKHTRPLTSCCWEPSGRFVFFGSEDNLVHRYDLQTQQNVSLSGHDSWVRAMDVSSDGQWLASGGYDGRLCLWPAIAESPSPKIAIDSAHAGWIRALAFSPDGKLVATCGNDRLVKVWDASAGTVAHEFAGHESHVYNVCFTPDQHCVVSCDLKGIVKCWHLHDSHQHRQVAAIEALYKYDTTFRADIGGARCMAFKPDGNQLAVGGITNVTNAFAGVGEIAVGLVDWPQSQAVKVLVGKDKIRGTAWGIAYHQAAQCWIGLAGGGGGGWLYFWSGQQVEEEQRFKLKTDGRGMSLSRDQQRVAVAHADSHLRIYGWE